MKTKTLQWIVMGFFALGFIGLAIPWTFPFFVVLTPLAVVVALAMLIMGHERLIDWRFFTAMGIVFALSYVVELLKVHVFFVEDVFFFGDSFGPVLLNIPLMIGLCWVALLYICAAVAERLNTNAVVKVLAGSGLVVLFDIALELVAHKLDFWYWTWELPIWNYVLWFVAAVIMLTIMKLFGVRIENKLATTMYVTLIIFLLFLHVII